MAKAARHNRPILEPRTDLGHGRLTWQSWTLIALGSTFLVVGIVLYTLGFAAPATDFRHLINFIMCVGLAIILSEIGTRADIRYRGAVITGAGAVAVLFYIILTPSMLCRLGIHCPSQPITAYKIIGYVKIPGATGVNASIVTGPVVSPSDEDASS